VAARRWPADSGRHGEAALLARLAAAGWRGGYGWGNGPGERYAEHSHDYDKALYCVTGSVMFGTVDGDLPLGPGDRLELDRGTAHSAIVGPDGVRCVEGHRS
jgi:hypothetical protein